MALCQKAPTPSCGDAATLLKAAYRRWEPSYAKPHIARGFLELRKTQPRLTVTAILERLRSQGPIEPDENGCSRSPVYRFLQKEGLHRHRLRAIANAAGVQPRLKKARHHLDVSSRPKAKRIVLCLTQRGSNLETTAVTLTRFASEIFCCG
jgi:hypothetical protein